ncbi:disease resistance protein TAO1-like [Cryptomeria japonica]|uniref:disease resistance protein TAO1-like n=1 Tax=Cryptomeria japonica TaxID=3369 RepID=UPI0025AD11CE|nr:disease resistance protein TAO1-like [Cryptomeria japonica]
MTVTRYKPSHRSPSSTSRIYDVFLSFRGEDVRRTFVDHLYVSLKNAGVNAFLDSHNIKRQDETRSAIQETIDNSEILIPIFSKKFADSHWCLDEVAHMCRANGIIIPLFYDVKPTELRNPWKGAYAKAFEEKKQRYARRRINEWKTALHKVSSFSGWSTEDIYGFEAELVKLIVQDVFKILDQNVTPVDEAVPQPLEEDPSDTIPQEIRNEPLRISKTILMGMEEHKSKVINLLNTDSDENVLTVSIYGNGGVGKTSLAKAIHNHIYLKFDATCIVYDVRHKAQNTNGVAKMQRQILKDLVKFKDIVNDEAHGKMLMKDRLRSIKALVILEYVDDWKQLEALAGDWFGPGSRVIVTTLDPNILKKENGSFVYELRGLDQEHALQLFSWHAFMRDQPEEDYKELSCKAVDICNRLPFSLEVLGAHLYNRDLSDWNQAIQTLECSSYYGKYAIPRLCYDSLKSEQKEMFLDMACLFTGRKRENTISFWEASHLHPNEGLTEMKLKSLIKLDEHNRLVMHSELRDMGRAIVADESPEPGKRSRLWKPEEVEQVIIEGKGTERVRCLTYLQQDVKFQTHSFQRMCNLQLLWLDGALLEGDYRKMPPDLKWLRWENCPLKCLPCEWNMKHLAVLDLSFSKGIEALWSEPSNIEGPKNLKVLKLNYCTSLQVLPDLANLTSLMQLEICGCKELRELPESFGFLTKLKYLDLSNCCNLSQLPNTITNLISLEVLFLSNCHSIKMLPDSFEDLGVLKKVKLDGMPLKNLPKSFRLLSCLEKLSLHGCHKLSSLPQPIGELNRLRYLDLNGCSSLQTLPDSIYELESLCRLDMTGCQRISLGAEIGDLVCLERLVLSNCTAIWKLPTSIGQLSSLQYLNLNHCTSLFRLPEELGNLVCLKEFVLNECYNLLELPQSIGKLSCLKTLEMEETYSLSVLPPNFTRLTSLQNLKAGSCPLPQHIGELSSLEILHLKSYKMSFLPPTFGTLWRLSKLYLHHCTEFLELPHLPKELIEVRIQDCLGIKKISNMSHMKRLKLLIIHNCRELVELPDFGFLKSLQELSISGCRNVKRIQGMEGLKSLRRVHVTGCRLAGSGSLILKPCQLIKEAHCLELLSFSANGVPECLEKKMETNGGDLLYVTLDSNEQCSGIILCFMASFKRGINSVGVELCTLRDGKEIFNTRLVNHSKTIEGDQIFVHILHKNHPMAMMLQSGDVVQAKADRDEERMLIRSGGMQFFSVGEDGKREDLILESLGKDLTMLMEDYHENLVCEDDE